MIPIPVFWLVNFPGEFCWMIWLAKRLQMAQLQCNSIHICWLLPQISSRFIVNIHFITIIQEHLKTRKWAPFNKQIISIYQLNLISQNKLWIRRRCLKSAVGNTVSVTDFLLFLEGYPFIWTWNICYLHQF